MIVKFFTHGTGGSGGVFNYLLKDKDQEDGLRRDAEVLRATLIIKRCSLIALILSKNILVAAYPSQSQPTK